MKDHRTPYPYIVVEVPTYITAALIGKIKKYLRRRFKEVKKISVKKNNSLIYGFRAYVVGHTVKTVTFDLANIVSQTKDSITPKVIEVKEMGEVKAVDSSIALVEGLYDVAYGELVSFVNSKIKGLVIDLLEDKIGVVILGDYKRIKAGDTIVPEGIPLSIRVGEKLLGRHVNPIGQPLDSSPIDSTDFISMPLEARAPSVLERKPITQPLTTGILAIDTMIPIGKGQRELILGDRQTGKTSIAIDTILSQKDKDMICIYVAIGQQAQKIARIIEILEEYEALNYTILVTATASDPASLQYLAPYSGMAIAEYFASHGRDVLVIFDDLTKHAWAYREISLLLKRPVGREAYPGDIFYLHSRLLERAGQFKKGSITALPIIETQEQDISAYIPTNLISITDGQIYLSLDLFNRGIKPAIDIGLSVSRVGSAAQPPILKDVAKSLRLTLAQYQELESFAQLGAKLDQHAQKQLKRGKILFQFLKQELHLSYPPKLQAVLLFIAQSGLLDEISIEKLPQIKQILLAHIPQSAWYQTLSEDTPLNDETKERIISNIKPLVKNHA